MFKIFSPLQFARPQELALFQRAILFRQFDQKREVGVFAYIFFKEGHLTFGVELGENYVIDRHPEGTVMPLLHRQPVVGKFAGHIVVRRHDNDLGATVAGFREKVGIRSPGHRDVGTAEDNI